MNEQMAGENRFFSPELMCRRPLAEIIRRLNSLPPEKDFNSIY